MADKTPNFGSAEEEVKYWREQALMFQKGMLEAREELEEFQVIVLRPLTRPRTLNILETSTLARPNIDAISPAGCSQGRVHGLSNRVRTLKVDVFDKALKRFAMLLFN